MLTIIFEFIQISNCVLFVFIKWCEALFLILSCMGNDVFSTLQRKFVRLASVSRKSCCIQAAVLNFFILPTRLMLELSESVIRLKFEFHYIWKFFWSSPKCGPAQFLNIFMKKWFSQFHQGSFLWWFVMSRVSKNMVWDWIKLPEILKNTKKW